MVIESPAPVKPVYNWRLRMLIAIMLFLLIPYALMATAFAQPYVDRIGRCWGHRGFDRAKWTDSALVYSRTAPRECMVDNLLKRHPLVGKTRAEVVSLLGEPRKTSYFSEYDLVYWLGPERSWIAIDSLWLVLRLGPDGRVTEARLVTD